MNYTGYVYLWHDTKAHLFYLGSHLGNVGDSYICSSPKMKNAYRKRPDTFRFRVLEYAHSDITDLHQREQRWLDMIKDEELYWTPNIYQKTCRYYNMKKNAFGGSYKGQNAGNSNIGGHNKGKPMSEAQKLLISIGNKGKPKSEAHKKKIAEAWARKRAEKTPV